MQIRKSLFKILMSTWSTRTNSQCRMTKIPAATQILKYTWSTRTYKLSVLSDENTKFPAVTQISQRTWSTRKNKRLAQESSSWIRPTGEYHVKKSAPWRGNLKGGVEIPVKSLVFYCPFANFFYIQLRGFCGSLVIPGKL